ncbi:hypothetical protein LUX57_00035 [Actinomadura madurae]|uniref:hypothetical protein n=1 Tax=Actinomadura madurae TaxID=1993 RepID=UPI0020D2560F|nr:hypothetical protein [Actinomadura madurae]MCP9963781.1 hypothetical protein [Actinomadura madurae]
MVPFEERHVTGDMRLGRLLRTRVLQPQQVQHSTSPIPVRDRDRDRDRTSLPEDVRDPADWTASATREAVHPAIVLPRDLCIQNLEVR